jgi:hypothetical protein
MANNDKMEVTCPDCGRVDIITRAAYNCRIRTGNIKGLCVSCVKKNWRANESEETKEKRRIALQLKRESRTPEQIEAKSRKLKEIYASRSEEEKASRAQKISDKVSSYYNNETDEQKEIRYQNMQNHYDTLSYDERVKLQEKCKQNGQQWRKTETDESRRERISKLIASLRKYHANLTDEEREARGGNISKGIKLYYSKETDEHKRERIKNQIYATIKFYLEANTDWFDFHSEQTKKGLDEWYNNLSPEEKIQLSELRSENTSKRWNSLSPEEKEQHRQKSIDYWNNLSEEEKAAVAKRSKDWWDNLSDEEKEFHVQRSIKRSKDYWVSLTEEERIKIRYKTAIGTAEAARAKPITNELESKFQQILDELNIPYQYQYTTVQFPKNWDFAIYDNPDALPIMLVDIDGWMHDIDFPIDPDKNRRGYSSLHEAMLYYDNRRTEQTDGIPYFIISHKTFEDDVEELLQKIYFRR